MNHSSAQDPSEVARLLAHKPGALMRAPMAIVLRDRMPGGMYAPPHHFKEDYREAIQALRVI